MLDRVYRFHATNNNTYYTTSTSTAYTNNSVNDTDINVITYSISAPIVRTLVRLMPEHFNCVLSA